MSSLPPSCRNLPVLWNVWQWYFLLELGGDPDDGSVNLSPIFLWPCCLGGGGTRFGLRGLLVAWCKWASDNHCSQLLQLGKWNRVTLFNLWLRMNSICYELILERFLYIYISRSFCPNQNLEEHEAFPRIPNIECIQLRSEGCEKVD